MEVGWEEEAPAGGNALCTRGGNGGMYEARAFGSVPLEGF